MSGNLVGEIKPMKCRFCGSTHTRGKKFCKAAGTKCDKCGKVGHFAKVCRSGQSQESTVKVSEKVDKPKKEVRKFKLLFYIN